MENMKDECIKYLENLIEDIKINKVSNNYTISEDVLERNDCGSYIENIVRYSITRTECIKKL